MAQNRQQNPDHVRLHRVPLLPAGRPLGCGRTTASRRAPAANLPGAIRATSGLFLDGLILAPADAVGPADLQVAELHVDVPVPVRDEERLPGPPVVDDRGGRA